MPPGYVWTHQCLAVENSDQMPETPKIDLVSQLSKRFVVAMGLIKKKWHKIKPIRLAEFLYAFTYLVVIYVIYVQ